MELAFQHLLGVGVAGHHQQARGAPVQAVDGVEIPLFPLLIVMMEEKIPQRIGKMAWAGVDGHPRGLVEHHHVPVLIDDVQGAGRGDYPAAPLGVRQAHRQHLPLPGTEAGTHPLAVHQNSVGEPLDPPHHRPRQAQVTLEQGVHLDARQRPGDRQV